jgi:hypothetical protein
MTPSLAQKVIDQREIKSMNIEHMKPNNIIDRAAHYINGDAVIKDIQNKAPEHKTGMILHELIIDGESYTAELFIDHDEMFIGTPDNGDIGMSIEAIAVYGYTDPKKTDSPAFFIAGNDARSLTDNIFKENRGLENEAMQQCVNTSPQLHDIFERYKAAHPEAEISPPQYKR